MAKARIRRTKFVRYWSPRYWAPIENFRLRKAAVRLFATAKWRGRTRKIETTVFEPIREDRYTWSSLIHCSYPKWHGYDFWITGVDAHQALELGESFVALLLQDYDYKLLDRRKLIRLRPRRVTLAFRMRRRPEATF
jgi:hypothetical protein